MRKLIALSLLICFSATLVGCMRRRRKSTSAARPWMSTRSNPLTGRRRLQRSRGRVFQPGSGMDARLSQRRFPWDSFC